MGKRVSEYSARKMGTQKLTTLFIPPEISYRQPHLPTGFHYPPGCGYSEECGSGYLININHSQIEPYYAAFKNFLGTTYPIDDSERYFFEADMIYNVFRSDFELSAIYSKLDLNRCAEIIVNNKEKYNRWVQYRTELFREKQVV